MRTASITQKKYSYVLPHVFHELLLPEKDKGNNSQRALDNSDRGRCKRPFPQFLS